MYCLMIGGLFPLFIGSYYFFLTMLEYFNLTILLDILMVKHIAYANLMVTGGSILCLTWFGVRKKIKWCWFHLCFIVFWAGGNDTFAMFYNLRNSSGEDYNFPLPLIPTIFIICGLVMTNPFKKSH